MTSAGVVWCLLSLTSSTDSKKKDIKRDAAEAEMPVKEEESDDETIGPISSSQQIKEELSSESPTPSPRESETGGEYDDAEETASMHPSGSGSGFQTPGAHTIQRRRSHFKEDIS